MTVLGYTLRLSYVITNPFGGKRTITVGEGAQAHHSLDLAAFLREEVQQVGRCEGSVVLG